MDAIHKNAFDKQVNAQRKVEETKRKKSRRGHKEFVVDETDGAVRFSTPRPREKLLGEL